MRAVREASPEEGPAQSWTKLCLHDKGRVHPAQEALDQPNNKTEARRTRPPPANTVSRALSQRGAGPAEKPDWNRPAAATTGKAVGVGVQEGLGEHQVICYGVKRKL